MSKSESTNKSPNKNAKKGFVGTVATFVRRIGLTIAVIAVLCLLCSVGSIYVSPLRCSFLGLLGLVFPLFWGINFLILLVLLPFSRRIAMIPFFGLIITASHALDYCPINLPSPAPKQGIKVMTYNTHGFGCFGSGDKMNDKEGRNKIALFMAEHNPDIIAYQEGIQTWTLNKSVLPVLKKKGLYHDNISENGMSVGCFSRFPIVGKEVLAFNEAERAAVFKLTPSNNDTIFLVVVHLQSMGLDNTDRNNFHHNIGYLKDEHEDLKLRSMVGIMKKIAAASVPRAKQAQGVAEFLKAHPNDKVIVCGDFNETPISYPYQKIINAAPLSDAFVESGNGFGRSYNKNGLFVRIDHIMYNHNHWKSHATKVMSNVPLSDHYPVITHLTEE